MTGSMTTISLYTKSGAAAATAYYRFYQYMEGRYRLRKRKMMSDRQYRDWMPIYTKPLPAKVYIMAVLYLRVLGQLIRDAIQPPDLMILSRRPVNKIMPPSYKGLLALIRRRGVRLIWDFDDEIIANGEMSRKTFDYLSARADAIVVASDNNRLMLRPEYRGKCTVMPTTDGDMFRRFTPSLLESRVASLAEEVRIIWVGTSVSLEHVSAIMSGIEAFAAADSRRVSLTVVCNRPLEYSPSNFVLNNIPWTHDRAIEEMESAHIGIMPLADNEITRAKGGFKLIQYLSIGLPVIGSPVGINDSIITARCGFKAPVETPAMWTDALTAITGSGATAYREYALAAYDRWQDEYSFPANRERWDTLIRSLAKKAGAEKQNSSHHS